MTRLRNVVSKSNIGAFIIKSEKKIGKKYHTKKFSKCYVPKKLLDSQVKVVNLFSQSKSPLELSQFSSLWRL
jgi:hypothetical protein